MNFNIKENFQSIILGTYEHPRLLHFRLLHRGLAHCYALCLRKINEYFVLMALQYRNSRNWERYCIKYFTLILSGNG